MQNQLTKPDGSPVDLNQAQYQGPVDSRGRPRWDKSHQKEETIVLSETVIHNSVGCKHYFVQKTGTSVECENCGLGLFGHAKDGVLIK